MLTALRSYQAIRAELKMFEEAAKAELQAVMAVLEDVGAADVVHLEEFKVTTVRAVSTSLDTQRLLEAGVTMAQIEAGTVTKPRKPYLLVTTSKETVDAHP